MFCVFLCDLYVLLLPIKLTQSKVLPICLLLPVIDVANCTVTLSRLSVLFFSYVSFYPVLFIILPSVSVLSLYILLCCCLVCLSVFVSLSVSVSIF